MDGCRVAPGQDIGTTLIYAHISTAKRMRDVAKHLEGK